MVVITRYLSPDPEGGAGSTEGAEGGTDVQLTEEQKQETSQLETLLSKSDLNEEEKKTLETLQEKYAVAKVGADGKPLTEEQIKEIAELESKLKAIQAKPEAERTAEENKLLADNTEPAEPKGSVYEEVDNLLGIPVEVDYGDVKPDSVEGIAKRESYIREQAAAMYDADLKEKFPRGYQFLAHLSRGGSEEDFFKPENQDFLSVKLSKTDESTQEAILRKALAIKGNTPAQVELLVTNAKDSGKLYEDSTAELSLLQKKQQAQQAALEKEEEERILAEEKDVSTFHTVLNSAVAKGINGNAIPVAERKNFLNYISNNIRYADGQFLHVVPLDPKEIEKHLAVEYFRFKGGNLKEVVDNKAKTLNASRFKNSIKYQITPKNAGSASKHYIPMAET